MERAAGWGGPAGGGGGGGPAGGGGGGGGGAVRQHEAGRQTLDSRKECSEDGLLPVGDSFEHDW